MRLLVATNNPGKVKEYQDLLAGLDMELCGLVDLGITDEVEETGQTFEENARLKATAYGQISGLLTLADDSGLEVEALGGAPGVFSVRELVPHHLVLDQRRAEGLALPAVVGGERQRPPVDGV